MNHLCKLPCQSDELFNVCDMRAGVQVQKEQEQDEEMARGGAQQAGTFTLVLVTARQHRLHNWLDCLAPHLQPPR